MYQRCFGLLYTILAGIFFVGQNLASRAYSKTFEKGLYQLIAMNAIATFVGGTALFALFRPGMISWKAMIFAAAFGILFVTTISMIMVTYAKGPMGISSMMIDMSVMILVLFSTIVWRETPTLIKGIAMAILMTVLVMLSLPDRKEDRSATRSWFIIALITMIMNGTLSIIQKSVFMVCPELSSTDFTFWSMAMAFAASAIAFLGLKFLGGKRFSEGQPVRKLPLIAAGQGFCTAAAYYCSNAALLRIQSIIVFPVIVFVNVGLLMLISVIFFGERINLRKGIAFVMGLVGTVMMNL